METAKIFSLTLYQQADQNFRMEVVGPSHEFDPEAVALLAEAAITFAVTISK
jgi:hypothetical protein